MRVTCAACGKEEGFSEGRCLACGGPAPAVAPAPAGPLVRCPKCRSAVQKSEKFCAKCGAKIPTRADRARAMNRKRERQENQQKVNRGRRWMLIVAVLTLFQAVFLYFSGMSEIDKAIREAEHSDLGVSAAERDAEIKATTGMTWAELIEQSRGTVRLMAGIAGVLGAAFIGLWWWAQINPFGAALTALLMYVTSQVIGAMMEPESLLKGILIKIFIVVALFSAVSAGHRERAFSRRRA
jgi:hypothetical protein